MMFCSIIFLSGFSLPETALIMIRHKYISTDVKLQVPGFIQSVLEPSYQINLQQQQTKKGPIILELVLDQYLWSDLLIF